jgi:hypothetical protein
VPTTMNAVSSGSSPRAAGSEERIYSGYTATR